MRLQVHFQPFSCSVVPIDGLTSISELLLKINHARIDGLKFDLNFVRPPFVMKIVGDVNRRHELIREFHMSIEHINKRLELIHQFVNFMAGKVASHTWTRW